MPGRGEGGDHGARGPANSGRRHGKPSRPGIPGGPPSGPKGAGPKPQGGAGRAPLRKTGGLNLRRIGGNDFEIKHPRCVEEMELDYAEGIELWRAGDPEAARDALRYALQGCGDNLWVHVALGRIALDEFKDPTLARGHFGYAFELAQKAFPPGFSGRLPRDRELNRPFFEAVDGLATCYDALQNAAEADALRRLAARLSRGGGPDRPGGPE